MNQSKKGIFLSAQWRNIILFNYAVTDEVLLPFLPSGCELDRINGSAYISLVAFQFLDTRVLGIKWLGFKNFPEINLRFYVKYQGKRCVCFIKEYVPSKLIAGIARLLYNEPYSALPMKMRIESNTQEIKAEYSIHGSNGGMETEVTVKSDSNIPSSNLNEHLFKEHDLGVGRSRRGATLSYEVDHPIWRVHPVLKYKLRVDRSALYGTKFDFLKDRKPDSVVFAQGSEITVYRKSLRLYNV